MPFNRVDIAFLFIPFELFRPTSFHSPPLLGEKTLGTRLLLRLEREKMLLHMPEVDL